MKVVLLKDVPGIGKRNEIKEVRDGYARNFLLPRKLAKAVTKAALKEIAVVHKKDEELLKRLREVARRLSERTLEFTLKTDEKGSVFGSVNKDLILTGLRDAGLITKERVSVTLAHPIKTLGEHELEVLLPHGVSAKLKVIVRQRT